MGNQLGDHRVVARWHLVACRDAEVDADALGQLELAYAAHARQERQRVLGVETHLDRVATRRRGSRHVAAIGDADHLGDQIDARHQLGYRVLDLDAGIELEEPDFIAADEKLSRASTAVVGGASEGNRGRVEPCAQRVVDDGRGALLEHLLVATLDRTVALAQRDDAAVGVGEQLDLDVMRALHETLGIDAPVTKRRLGLACCCRCGFLELVGRTHDAHPASATTGRRLDQQRIANRCGIALWEHRHASGLGNRLGLQLVARALEHVGARTNPDDTGCLDRTGRVRALRQKAVTRMHCVGTALARSRSDCVRVEVRGDLDHAITGTRVEGVAVVGRLHRDRLDAELATGPGDAGGDLAAVGDQD